MMGNVFFAVNLHKKLTIQYLRQEEVIRQLDQMETFSLLVRNAIVDLAASTL